MSNFRKNSLNRASSKEERKTVDAIEVQLQAQVARSSYLQSRLNSAMDSLDALRIRHRRELAVERETKERLKRKMDELVEYTAKVEEERDEMRECVTALIEKVEITHDFSEWPHRQISFLEPLEPPAGNNIHKPGSQHLPNTQLDTATQYPTIIALLRSELEKERASHAHTHDTAELEILTLRAQLARREAELEGCLVHSETEHRGFVLKAAESGSEPLKHKKASLRSKTVTEVQPQQKPASSFTPEEASQLLGLRAEKNRRLEAEIKQIASRLEQARAENATSQVSTEAIAPQSMDDMDEEVHSSVVIEDDNDTVVNPLPAVPEPKTPQSPDLQPVVSLDMPSPFTMTPMRASSPMGLVALAVRNSHKGAAQQELLEATEAEPTLQRFEEQVDRLAVEIDAFKVQRSDMLDFIAQQQHENIPEARVDKAVSVEENLDPQQTDSTPSVVFGLRSEIERIKRNAAQREFELLAEIQMLRREVEGNGGHLSSGLDIPFMPGEALAQSSAKRRGPLSEHEDDGGEKSMELDTPCSEVAALQSWIVPEGVALPQAEEHDFDASLIPLPPSPDDANANLPASPPLRSSTIQDRPPTPFSIVPSLPGEEEIAHEDDRETPVSSDERLKALENELADARQQVTDRDLTLVELQQLINELRVQMRDAGLKIM
ncbi:hypothetical protein BC629DRAFT_8380 [Irpex lacteus]|nr:hypothetical protein BC629DRAFT_8380 [Irpex lacteus]